MSSVLWQPSFSLGYDFKVLLDQDFARAMATAANQQYLFDLWVKYADILKEK
ncbi:hypothetical protein HYT55_03760 [Candidatus Woesearchaeota archaeon]|nr:hypothetical protein [Candidatus Woesearchaeota archaeon]